MELNLELMLNGKTMGIDKISAISKNSRGFTPREPLVQLRSIIMITFNLILVYLDEDITAALGKPVVPEV